MKARKTKVCGMCKKRRRADQFYADNRNLDKLRWDCKFCSKKLMHEYNMTHKEEVAETNRRWRAENPTLVKQTNKRNFKKWYADPAHKKLHADRRKKVYDQKKKEKEKKVLKSKILNHLSNKNIGD